MFRARCQTPWYFCGHDLGWGAVCQAVDVIVIPGCEHQGIIREPHVQKLTKALQSALDAASAPHRDAELAAASSPAG
ncbi:MAG: hypothetical protein EHM42_01735 [Planctomycetaceae bacterium]|nr:MAG: hypothetical protein EHM42_01735 [Planctomycetaceae bacterium]